MKICVMQTRVSRVENIRRTIGLQKPVWLIKKTAGHNDGLWDKKICILHKKCLCIFVEMSIMTRFVLTDLKVQSIMCNSNGKSDRGHWDDFHAEK